MAGRGLCWDARLRQAFFGMPEIMDFGALFLWRHGFA